MSEYLLSATLREPAGKGGARQLRANSKVPGVFYGHNEANVHFSVNTIDLTRMMRGRHTVINLQLDGGALKPCVIRELQRDPVDDHFIHIDLLGLHQGEKVSVTVPLKLSGVPKGVKEGGILEHSLVELTVECLPQDIPEEVTVDVSNLSVGESLHVSDLNLPGLKVLDDPHAAVAHVASPLLHKEKAGAGEAEVAAAE